MVCEVSVRNYFDENLITMTYFSKIMMIYSLESVLPLPMELIK